VAGGGHTAAAGPYEVDDLVTLASSQPWAALTRARAVLAGRPGPYEASVAHQAAGIVLRDCGDVEAGVRELRQALRQARRLGSAEREADVLAGLGVALFFTGRTAAGLAAFEAALRRSSGVLAAQVLYRRGILFVRLGRFPAALEDARHAVVVLRRAGDTLWTARALNLRASAYLRLGSTGRADADYVSAIRLYSTIGQELEALDPLLNRALTAHVSGDLPAALAYLDAATPSHQRLNVPTIAVRVKRCAVLLAAGLAGDARTEAEAALGEIEEIHGHLTEKADLLLLAANCALAAAQPQAALDWARAACRLYRAQRRSWQQAQAARVLIDARHRVGPVSASLLREASRAAARLDELGASDAAQAHLLAGRVALELGRRDDAESHLAALARTRRRGPALSRVSGWLGEALRAEAAGRPSRMLAACQRGLDVLDEYRLALGASELRAQATVHGAELAALAQRHAAQARRPRLLLTWSERWRATAYAVPPVRPSADPELNGSLAALRGFTGSLDQPRGPNTTRSQNTSLRKERQRLEAVVRASALRARSNGRWIRAPFSPAALLDELGPGRLIEIVDVDGQLYVLACGSGRVRQFTAGRVSDAARTADFAHFALRRLARSRPGTDPASALAVLDQAGPALQEALLGPAVRHLGDGPVIIVPTGQLHSVPWAVMPALADRVTSVAPSATAWMRAHRAAEPRHRRVVLARGPGLASDGAEVPELARLYDDVTVLEDAAATADQVLSALDGAWLAHIAAHGSFRADSPLFSSLRMHDGPLTVYDFERLNRAPYRLVLSSCEGAGGNELLGLVSSLLPLGTAGIIAGLVPLNDEALVPLMVELHGHLRAGQTLAESLYRVRRAHQDDPVLHATATSLVALGAA
jgi:hypothetical protein